MPFWKKRSKSATDAKRIPLGSQVENWLQAKYQKDKNIDSVFVNAKPVISKQSLPNLNVGIKRNDSLTISARRKLSDLFGGKKLSSSGSIVCEERKIQQSPLALTTSQTNGVRLAEPEPSISDFSDFDDPADSPESPDEFDPNQPDRLISTPIQELRKEDKPLIIVQEPKEDKHKSEPKSPKSRIHKSEPEKRSGFLNLFRRRIEGIMPATSGEKAKKADTISVASNSHSDDALKSAFYNVAVFGMAACCVVGALAAYYLFYDFVKPAMWAVICGIVLYPLKRRVTNVVRSWLDHLNLTGTPLMIGVVTLPLNITNGWGEFLLDSVTNNFKTVLLMVAAFPTSALLLHFETVPKFLVTTKQALLIVDNGMRVFKAFWVPLILITYILYVFVSNAFKSLRNSVLCHPIFSWTIWIAGLAHVCSYFGPLRTLLFSIVILLCTTYYIPIFHGFPSPYRLLPRKRANTKRQSLLMPASPKRQSAIKNIFRKSHRESLAVTDLGSSEATGPAEHESEMQAEIIATDEISVTNESDIYLKRLLIVCFFVYVSLHLWMMLLLVIPIGVALIRRLAVIFDIYAFVKRQWSRLCSALGDDTRLILPPPLVHFFRVLIHIDRQVIYYLRHSMDFVGSLTAMLLLMIGLALVTGFVIFQLYYESMHLVQLSANLANQTLTQNPALQKWLRESVQVESVTELAEQAWKKSMTMARGWLSTQVHEIVENDQEKANLLESQIMTTFDTMFERWFRRNATNESGLSIQKTAIAQWADTWTAIGESGGDIDWNFLDNLQEYLTVAWSVADSAWLIIKNNMEILLIALTQIGSTLLASGSAVIDFFLDTIVFLTFLVYVLSESDDEYKPLKMIKDLVPGGKDTASTITVQVEEAVNGVFFATSKIAIFYGMLTWLTHTLFAVNLVFIPSVLAALFAAIPFFGAYLVALPAILELWVIRGEPFLAILLFALHYIPSYVVDDAIYSEITLTTPLLSGMAIAGGILWWGLEGAIFGPLVLCFILVLGGVYKTICFQTMSLSSHTTTPIFGRSRKGSVVEETSDVKWRRDEQDQK